MNAPTPLVLEVVSLAGPIWSGEIREVDLPGSAGRFGVLARHTPLLTTLREGMLRVAPLQGEPMEIYVSGGFVEVQPDKVTVLADLAVRDADWEHAQAEAARERAASGMAQAFTDEDYMAMHVELIHRYSLQLRGRPPR
ncbi:ATP synthase F1 subunit epsilon [Stenotrophomonas panacihumi]|uniref:ATP synthase epsilon chain n=1 Tax=Stenotrophomonas panacihumi TaxID=676599 RepID=A0A0R0A7C3_9GAMM|nr:ATP synthase F1 subunit epsilon [Stenotrophomonas panacihumi]KRG41008.1 ATP synthase F1 subunit epsilon [Stenotrophomonas panacihumi]PTN53832.1 ATP synthase F1 subunit epsilon [Stenotrophomonas panacihumi]